MAFVRVVTDGYPAALGMPLVAGRDFSEHDTLTSEPVLLINETMARTVFPGRDPIGQYILGGCAKERRIVGVVGDVRHLALEQASGNEMYLPMRQCRDQSSADLVVRSSLAPEPLAAALREALRPIAPNLSTNDFRTLQSLVDKSVSPRRFMVMLLGAFAVFALVLASLGIYGLISYSVNQRTQEIGIRMAIGASARRCEETDHRADALARGDRRGHRRRGLVDHGARVAEPVVRSHRQRSRNLCGHVDRADVGGRDCGIPAGAPGLRNRSDGGVAFGVNLCRGGTLVPPKSRRAIRRDVKSRL